ncbi:uncharacterized protein [Dermacentor albipictus]|uniref:uncharacterized protein n=1 Tax=Dermacentor albipictus TaxID=60249 RepID=UPI0031FBEB5C
MDDTQDTVPGFRLGTPQPRSRALDLLLLEARRMLGSEGMPKRLSPTTRKNAGRKNANRHARGNRHRREAANTTAAAASLAEMESDSNGSAPTSPSSRTISSSPATSSDSTESSPSLSASCSVSPTSNPTRSDRSSSASLPASPLTHVDNETTTAAATESSPPPSLEAPQHGEQQANDPRRCHDSHPASPSLALHVAAVAEHSQNGPAPQASADKSNGEQQNPPLAEPPTRPRPTERDREGQSPSPMTHAGAAPATSSQGMSNDGADVKKAMGEKECTPQPTQLARRTRAPAVFSGRSSRSLRKAASSNSPTPSQNVAQHSSPPRIQPSRLINTALIPPHYPRGPGKAGRATGLSR